MRAVRCHQFGPPEELRVDDVPELADPADNEVVISVRAAGVNFPDTLIIHGKYQFQPDFPFIPGGEVSGIIKAVGKKVGFLREGDRVIAGTGWGSFADEVTAMASNTFKIPHDVSFEKAAVLAEAYGTSYHALVDRAEIKKGQTLLVLGASGGVGIAAVQLGRVLGTRVIAAASTDEKLVFCKQHGADILVNYSKANLKETVREVTDGRGVDVVYDPVGGTYTEQALRTIAWKGRYLIVGFAAGDYPRIPMNLPLLKGCALVGVFWGGFFRKEPEANRGNISRLLEMLRSGEIDPPINKEFHLENTSEALREIMERKVLGKNVIRVRDV